MMLDPHREIRDGGNGAIRESRVSSCIEDHCSDPPPFAVSPNDCVCAIRNRSWWNRSPSAILEPVRFLISFPPLPVEWLRVGAVV